jgi:hypothetical protein
MEAQKYTFPDEAEANDEIIVEIDESDIPEEDKGKAPMPKPIVEEVEADELEAYSDAAKQRLKQMRKMYHDERRAKDEAFREQQAALNMAQKLFEENKKLRSAMVEGGTEYVATMKRAADLELENAKQAYRTAYESNDIDAITEANRLMHEANLKKDKALNLQVPTLQEQENVLQQPRQQAPVTHAPDDKALAWQQANPWFGDDREMTATALGIHEKLIDDGVPVGSDEYYSAINKTMRKRYNDYFKEPEKAQEPDKKPTTVVAPATRSTSPKRVKLKPEEIRLAKRLGITPELYWTEKQRLETANG